MTVEVRWLSLSDEPAARLRDLGIREGSALRIVGNQGRLIVGIGAARVGVPGDLADRIFVEEVAAHDHAGRPEARPARRRSRLGK